MAGASADEIAKQARARGDEDAGRRRPGQGAPRAHTLARGTGAHRRLGPVGTTRRYHLPTAHAAPLPSQRTAHWSIWPISSTSCCAAARATSTSPLATPPPMRLHGGLQAIKGPVLTSTDTRELIYGDPDRGSAQAARDRSRDRLQLRGARRGPVPRENAYFQRGTMAAALRVVPTVIKAAGGAGAPRLPLPAGQLPPRPGAGHRPHRLGQVHDARRVIDEINEPRGHIITIEDPIEFLHRESAAWSTSARWAPTPAASPPPCAAPSPGPRRHPGRRDARPGDDPASP